MYSRAVSAKSVFSNDWSYLFTIQKSVRIRGEGMIE
jgi:hypothetical protein